MVKLGLGAVLSNCQIHPPISIVIAERSPSSLPIHFHAAHMTGNHFKLAPPISSQPDAPPRVIPCRLFVHSKKILTQKNVLLSVAVHVTHAHSKGGRVLRLARQRDCLKSPAAIQ